MHSLNIRLMDGVYVYRRRPRAREVAVLDIYHGHVGHILCSIINIIYGYISTEHTANIRMQAPPARAEGTAREVALLDQILSSSEKRLLERSAFPRHVYSICSYMYTLFTDTYILNIRLTDGIYVCRRRPRGRGTRHGRWPCWTYLMAMLGICYVVVYT